MSRHRLGFNYRDAPILMGRDRGSNYAADEPEEGYYQTRRRGGVYRPIAIWYGPPLDPVTGEEMDRMWRWNCLYMGRLINVATVWPECKKNPIDRAEYDYLIARAEHAAKHDRTDPFHPKAKGVDWLTSPPAF